MSYKIAIASGDSVAVYTLISNSTPTPSSQLEYSIRPETLTSKQSRILSIQWSPDFNYLTVVLTDHVNLYSTDGSLLESIQFPSQKSVTCVRFPWRSSRYLYFASEQGSLDKWDRVDKSFTSISHTHPNGITQFVISCDDTRIALASKDGDVSILSLRHATTTRLESPFDSTITCLDFYPFKKSILAVAGKNGSISLFDLSGSATPVMTKPLIHKAPIQSLLFAPCNKHFYCSVGYDGMLFFHEMQAGTSATSKSGVLQSYHSEIPLTSISINDQHVVAAGTSDGTVLIYDIRLKAIAHKIDLGTKFPVDSVAFQPVKWVCDAVAQENVKAHASVPATPQTISASTPSTLHPKSLNATNAMDMFSPVGRSKLAERGDKADSFRKALLKKKIPSYETVSKAAAPSELLSSANLLASTPSQPSLTETDDCTPRSVTRANSASNAKPLEALETPTSSHVILSEKDKLGTTFDSMKRSIVANVTEKLQATTPQIHIASGTSTGRTQAKAVPTKQINNAETLQVIESAVEDTLLSFEERIRSDIRDLHVEIIRQFHVQKMELSQMMESFLTARQPPEDVSFF